MDKTAEVIIIGGGVIGTSIAYHLAKMGCKNIVILEKEYIGFGSTGKCAGGIRQQFSTEINIKLSMESRRFFEHFEEEIGYPIDFYQNGYLILANTEEEMKIFQQNLALQDKLGLKVYLLSPQDVKKIIPQLNTEDILGATYCPTDGFADPSSVVQGFASSCRKMGAKIYEKTEAVGIEFKGEKIKKIVTNKGKFETAVLVNAAGPYAGIIGKMIGLDIPIRPSRRHIFVTEPLDKIRKNSPMIIDFHSGFWFRREGPSLIFGMRNPNEKEGFDTSIDWDFLTEVVAEVACHRLPLIADTGIMNAWAGLHADTPDCQAILGEVSGMEGVYLACGFSGHGFMHSPAVGKIIAELIFGEKPFLDISSLSPDRFSRFSFQSQEEKIFI
ncbi:FAD-binding oxidoreductase [Candidatus Aerophobetes bacterium]|nr:FAD-binding oxidoreductase [Candidatus Aerophobetes bacterium]